VQEVHAKKICNSKKSLSRKSLGKEKPWRIFFTDRWLPLAPLMFALQAPQVYVSRLLVSTAESNLRLNFSIPGETKRLFHRCYGKCQEIDVVWLKRQ
jgi:hypothetical protein